MTTSHKTPPILSGPGAPTLLGSSIIARLPLAMFSIALLVHAQRLTGSFALAGIVGGAYAISGAIAAPLLGRLVDRCGQTRVLLACATATALVLVTTGMLPASTPPLLLVGLAGATGLGGGTRHARGLTLLLAALALGHGALILTAGSVFAIGAVLVLAGATIAPTAATIYAMVDRAAPAGTTTEAFSWLMTASSTGAALGAAVAGALAQSAGAPAAFAFAGAAGGLVVVIAALGARNLQDMASKPVGVIPAVAV
jgi:MFS family permease